AVYNMPLALRLSGELDVAALRAAVTDVLDRHEVLRTMYPSDRAGPAQVVLPVEAVGVDLSPVPVTEAELIQRVGQVLGTGFDVAAAVPVRARLFRVGDEEHVLAVAVHHIAGDGSSIRPFARDVMVAYAARSRGQMPGWAPLPVQYADYALWQREMLGEADDPESMAGRQLAFWKRELAGLAEMLALPTDRPRPAVASMRGGRIEFTVEAGLHRRVNVFAREHDATSFMVVHAVLTVLLARLSGSDDIAVGTPIAGRGEHELDDLVGMFVNTLVLRTRVEPGSSFLYLLEHTREVDLAALAHAEVPFEWLVEELAPARSTAHAPLFQVLLVFQNFAPAGFELPGLTVEAMQADLPVAKFDLQSTFVERLGPDNAPAGMDVEFTFATDLFDETTVHGFADRFVRILEAVTADPAMPVGDLPLLEAHELQRMAVWNETAHPVPERQLLDGFAAQVAATPDAVAVVFEDVRLAYAELGARVHRLARHLISLGVGPETLVAVAMPRSIELLVGIYAIVEAGGGYVPVDPDLPAERIGQIFSVAEPVCVLTTGEGTALPETSTVPVLRIDALDLTETSALPVADAERIVPLRP
ncbi:condensation domain-containing protein, partial [Nocardia sp. bgisy118]|uniref:condensation domain-containing protein n=1 Tax=Nocardia sp. bgisy118 TaxID=3413786 RepID=UPI003F49F560